MAGNTKDAWDEVGERFAEWGRQLSARYREKERERAAPSVAEDRRKLEEAAQAVVRQLDLAFTSLGETLRDPQAKQSLSEAGRAFREALSTTVSEAGERIRKRTG
ncbi:MAG TPA: hypothetical protein VE646_12790 [Actinomycetota bacterium]|jgi:DNA-binding ferritin-like protein|nr:hypothetical protein [Actinomycetota bacterium]